MEEVFIAIMENVNPDVWIVAEGKFANTINENQIVKNAGEVKYVFMKK